MQLMGKYQPILCFVNIVIRRATGLIVFRFVVRGCNTNLRRVLFTGALRENNQQKIRSATLSLEPKIKNRRLAILLTLHRCYLKNKCLNLQELIKYLLLFESLFIVDKASFEAIMCEEINIGFVAGIPFEIDDDGHLKPMTGLELSELLDGAPDNVVSVIEDFKL